MNYKLLLERLRRDEPVHADEVNEFLYFRGLRPCPHSHHSHDEEFAECARRKEMNMFTEDDHKFLRAVGVDPGPTPDKTRLVAQPDGTVRLLEELGIPVNRENYLRLAFAGNPPQEPLDGEIEAELPIEVQECPSGGHSDEPSYTTISGIPICSECGKSTRNRNNLICAPCRNRTRLMLTAEDRKFLHEVGVKVNS
jgi:hypothetical protein